MSCKVSHIENVYRNTKPALADVLTEIHNNIWDEIKSSNLFRIDGGFYLYSGKDTKQFIKQVELIDKINSRYGGNIIGRIKMNYKGNYKVGVNVLTIAEQVANEIYNGYPLQVLPYVANYTKYIKLVKPLDEIVTREGNQYFYQGDIYPTYEDAYNAKFKPKQVKKISIVNSLTKDELLKLFKSYLPDASVKDLQFLTQIALEEEARRYSKNKDDYKTVGGYINGIIKLANNENSVPLTYFRHELFHKIFTEYLTKTEQKILFQNFQKKYNVKNIDELEEKLAEEFEVFRNNKYTPEISWFEKIFNKILRFFGFIKANTSNIEALFNQIENRKLLYKVNNEIKEFKPKLISLSDAFKNSEAYKKSRDIVFSYIENLAIVGEYKNVKVINFYNQEVLDEFIENYSKTELSESELKDFTKFFSTKLVFTEDFIKRSFSENSADKILQAIKKFSTNILLLDEYKEFKDLIKGKEIYELKEEPFRYNILDIEDLKSEIAIRIINNMEPFREKMLELEQIKKDKAEKGELLDEAELQDLIFNTDMYNSYYYALKSRYNNAHDQLSINQLASFDNLQLLLSEVYPAIASMNNFEIENDFTDLNITTQEPSTEENDTIVFNFNNWVASLKLTKVVKSYLSTIKNPINDPNKKYLSFAEAFVMAKELLMDQHTFVYGSGNRKQFSFLKNLKDRLDEKGSSPQYKAVYEKILEMYEAAYSKQYTKDDLAIEIPDSFGFIDNDNFVYSIDGSKVTDIATIDEFKRRRKENKSIMLVSRKRYNGNRIDTFNFMFDIYNTIFNNHITHDMFNKQAIIKHFTEQSHLEVDIEESFNELFNLSGEKGKELLDIIKEDLDLPITTINNIEKPEIRSEIYNHMFTLLLESEEFRNFIKDQVPNGKNIIIPEQLNAIQENIENSKKVETLFFAYKKSHNANAFVELMQTMNSLKDTEIRSTEIKKSALYGDVVTYKKTSSGNTSNNVRLTLLDMISQRFKTKSSIDEFVKENKPKIQSEEAQTVLVKKKELLKTWLDNILGEDNAYKKSYEKLTHNSKIIEELYDEFDVFFFNVNAKYKNSFKPIEYDQRQDIQNDKGEINFEIVKNVREGNLYDFLVEDENNSFINKLSKFISASLDIKKGTAITTIDKKQREISTPSNVFKDTLGVLADMSTRSGYDRFTYDLQAGRNTATIVKELKNLEKKLEEEVVEEEKLRLKKELKEVRKELFYSRMRKVYLANYQFLNHHSFSFNQYNPVATNSKLRRSILSHFEDGGKKEQNDYGPNERIVHYQNETDADFYLRSFSVGFLGGIYFGPNSEEKNLTYKQFSNILSNRIYGYGVETELSNTNDTRASLENFLDSFVNRYNDPDVSDNNLNKVINFDIFVKALENITLNPREFIKMNAKKAYEVDLSKALLKNKKPIEIIETSEELEPGLAIKKLNSETKKLLIDEMLKELDKIAEDVLDEFKEYNVPPFLNYHDFLTDSDIYIDVKEKFVENGLVSVVNKLLFNEKFKSDPELNKLKNFLSVSDVNGRYMESWNDLGKRYLSDNPDTNPDIKRQINEKKIGDDLKSFLQESGYTRQIKGELYDAIRPLLKLFIYNDYVNSYFLDEITMGHQYEFSNSGDIIKRRQGLTSPGLLPYVDGGNIGMKENFYYGVIEDEVISNDDKEFGLIPFLKRMGFNDNEIKDFETYSGKDFTSSDGQGFMLPERLNDLILGFGKSYQAGAILKPQYYYKDKDGISRMVKYSSIVLSDGLVETFPKLKILRDKMEAGFIKPDGTRQKIDEAVFKSAVKVGIPTELPTHAGIFSDANIKSSKYEIKRDHIFTRQSAFEASNLNYRLQLNPLHTIEEEEGVAKPTQLYFFIKALNTNTAKANRVFDATAKLQDLKANKFFEKLDLDSDNFNESFARFLRETLDPTDPAYDQIKELAFNENSNRFSNKKSVAWNHPAIVDKIFTHYMSELSKASVETRIRGGKLVLQTTTGTEERIVSNGKGKVSTKLDELQILEKDGIIYSETYLPKGYYEHKNGTRVSDTIVNNKTINEKKELLWKGEWRWVGLVDEETQNAILNNLSKGRKSFKNKDAIAIRIPTSEIHSSLVLEVVGFIDNMGSNTIIVPKRIVNIHGHDFDVDSLFVMRRETFDGLNLGSVLNKEYLEKLQTAKEDLLSYVGFKLVNDSFTEMSDTEFEKFINDLEKNIDTGKREKGNEIIHELNIRRQKNIIVNTLLDIASDAKNKDRVLLPISTDPLTDEFKKYSTKNPELDPDFGMDESNIKFRNNARKSSVVGLSVTGGIANSMKVVSYLTDKNANVPLGKDITLFKDKVLTNLKLGVDNKRLWANLDSILNGALDNVKLQVLPKLRINNITQSLVVGLLATGNTLEETSILLLQPVMKSISSIGGWYQGSLAWIPVIKSQLKNYFGDINLENLGKINNITQEDYVNTINKYGHLTIYKLIKIAEDSKTSAKDKKIIDDILKQQAYLLNQLITISELGQELFDLSRLINVLTKEYPVFMDKINSFESIERKLFEFDASGDNTGNFKEDKILKVQDFFGHNPHMKSALNILNKGKLIIRDKFLKHSLELEDALKSNKILQLAFTNKNPDVDLENKKSEFTQYLFSSLFNHFINFKLKLDDEKTNKIQTTILNKKAKDIKDYKFLAQLMKEGLVQVNKKQYIVLTPLGKSYNLGTQNVRDLVYSDIGNPVFNYGSTISPFTLYNQEAFIQHFINKIRVLKIKFAQNTFTNNFEIKKLGRDGLMYVRFSQVTNPQPFDIDALKKGFDELSKYNIELVTNQTISEDSTLVTVDNGNHSYTYAITERSEEERTGIESSTLQQEFVQFSILQDGMKGGKNGYAQYMNPRTVRQYYYRYENYFNALLKNKSIVESIVSNFALDFALNNTNSFYDSQYYMKTNDIVGVKDTPNGTIYYDAEGDFNGKKPKPLLKRTMKNSWKKDSLYLLVYEEGDKGYYIKLGDETQQKVYHLVPEMIQVMTKMEQYLDLNNEDSVKKVKKIKQKKYSISKSFNPFYISLNGFFETVNDKEVIRLTNQSLNKLNKLIKSGNLTINSGTNSDIVFLYDYNDSLRTEGKYVKLISKSEDPNAKNKILLTYTEIDDLKDINFIQDEVKLADIEEYESDNIKTFESLENRTISSNKEVFSRSAIANEQLRTELNSNVQSPLQMVLTNILLEGDKNWIQKTKLTFEEIKNKKIIGNTTSINGNNTVNIDKSKIKDNEDYYNILLHELSHAKTQTLLTIIQEDLKQLSTNKDYVPISSEKQRQAYFKLQSIQKLTLNALRRSENPAKKRAKVLNDINEFVAEVFDERDLQKFMISYKVNNKSLFSRFIDKIIELFGLSNDNLLAHTLALIVELTEEELPLMGSISNNKTIVSNKTRFKNVFDVNESLLKKMHNNLEQGGTETTHRLKDSGQILQRTTNDIHGAYLYFTDADKSKRKEGFDVAAYVVERNFKKQNVPEDGKIYINYGGKSGDFTKEEALKHYREVFDKGKLIGKINELHVYIEIAKDPAEKTRLIGELQNYVSQLDIETQARYETFSQLFSSKDITKTLFKNFINTNALEENIIPEIKDEIESGVGVFSRSLGWGGVMDLLIKHFDGDYSAYDIKSGTVNEELLSHVEFVYKKQPGLILENNMLIKHKIQIMMYALMLKLNIPSAQFRQIGLVHVPFIINKSALRKYLVKYDQANLRVHEAEQLLLMMKQSFQDKKMAIEFGLLPEGAEKSLWELLEEEYKSNGGQSIEDLFNAANYYKFRSSSSTKELIKEARGENFIAENKAEKLYKLQKELVQVSLKNQNTLEWKKTFNTLTGKSDDDLEKIVELTEQILLMTRSSGMDPRNAEDIGFFTSLMGTWKDFDSSMLRIWNNLRVKQLAELTKRSTQISDQLEVKTATLLNKDYKMFNPSYQVQFGKFLKFDKPAVLNGQEIERLVLPTDKEYQSLTENEKEFVDYLNNLFKSFFTKDSYLRSTAFIDENGKSISHLELNNMGRDKPFEYYDGFFPKIMPETDEEIVDVMKQEGIIGGTKKTIANWIRDNLSTFYQHNFENSDIQVGVPIRHLGNSYIDSKKIYSRHLTKVAWRFAHDMAHKELYDPLYHLARAVDTYLSVERTNLTGLNYSIDPITKEKSSKYPNTKRVLQNFMKTEAKQIGIIPFEFFPKRYRDVNKDGNQLDFANKGILWASNVAAGVVMHLKPKQALGNALAGMLVKHQQALKFSIGKRLISDLEANQIDFTFSTLQKADLEYWKYVGDSMLGKVRENKMFLFADKFAMLQDNYILGSNKKRFRTEMNHALSYDKLYLFHSIAEDYMTYTTMTAQLKQYKIKVKDEKGNEIEKSMWDLYEVAEYDRKGEIVDKGKGGTGVYTLRWTGPSRLIKVGEVVEKIDGMTFHEINRFKAVIDMMFGDYRSEDQTVLSSYAITKSILTLKKFYLRILLNAFLPLRPSEALGYYKAIEQQEGEDVFEWNARVVEGKWITLIGMIKMFKDHFIFKKGGRSFMEEYNKLAPEQRLNLIEAGVTLGMMFAMMGIGRLIFGAANDDDPLKKAWDIYLVENASQQYNVVDVLRTSRTFITPIWLLKGYDLAAAGVILMESSIMYGTGNQEGALTQDGNLRGLLPVLKNTPYVAWAYDIVNSVNKLDTEQYFELAPDRIESKLAR